MDQARIRLFAFQLVMEADLTAAAKQQYFDARAQNEGSVSAAVTLPVRSIIMSAGLVSQTLFAGRRGRSQLLATAFGIGDQHDILKNREVRDSLMHTDERLDTLLADLPNNPPLKPGMGMLDKSPLTMSFWQRFSPGTVVFDSVGDGGMFMIMGLRVNKQKILERSQETIRYLDAADAVIDVGVRAQRWLDDNPGPPLPL